ncbi:hypothetical protein FACS1894172_15490 [Spirochaetia bacterium]|nr:hypothetical protein FACS1894172_15490 [Spirochaetia bacterium]
MLEFVKSVFRGFFELILWINLIFCTIAGGIIGNIGSRHPIIGGFLGLICGLFMDIVGGGFIAVNLNMDANIEQLKNSMKTGSSRSVIDIQNSSENIKE